MALETATYISDLVSTNPTASDNMSQGDDHIRLLKSALKSTFPNVSGAVTATHTELNYVDGVTSALQTQLNDLSSLKAPLASPTFTGTVVLPATTSVGTVSATELGYLDGVTSALQTQIDGKAASVHTHAISDVTGLSVAVCPTGAVIPYAGDTEPSGWLLCAGQSLSRVTYAALFAVIGTTYGSVDGDSFTLPDLRGRVVAGQDDMGGTSANRLTAQTGGVDGDVLGASGGAETHTLTTAQMPAHNHFVAANVSTSSGSPSLSNSQQIVWSNSTGGSGTYNLNGTSTAATIGLTSSTGGGAAHNNVQPTIILNYIIKT